MSGSLSADGFNRAAKGREKKRNSPPPVSVRLSWDEYEQLRRDAGALSMAAFIRLRLFGKGEIAGNRKAYAIKKPSPSAELTMIGQILGRLGTLGMATSLADIAAAANTGALPVSPEMEDEIHDACDAVRDIRARLITALGVKS